MNRKLHLLLFAFVLTLASVVTGNGQQRTTATINASDPLNVLPASDGVMFVDVQRIMRDVLPRSLAGSPKMAEINAEIDRFRQRTGLDLRSFERAAVGVRFTNPSARVTKMEPVAVLMGNFNADSMVAAGRFAAKGKYRTEQYKGKTIHTFSLNENVRLLGLFNARLTDVAVVSLSSNMLAVGERESVRRTIDAGGGAAARNAELIALATRNPNAVLGFGSNVPASATRDLDFGNAEITRSIASIRQSYGSIGTTTSGYDMTVIARTSNAQQAKSLNDNLAAVKQFAPLLIAQLSGERAELARKVSDSLRITTQGNDVQARIEVAQTDVSTLLRVF